MSPETAPNSCCRWRRRGIWICTARKPLSKRWGRDVAGKTIRKRCRRKQPLTLVKKPFSTHGQKTAITSGKPPWIPSSSYVQPPHPGEFWWRSHQLVHRWSWSTWKLTNKSSMVSAPDSPLKKLKHLKTSPEIQSQNHHSRRRSKNSGHHFTEESGRRNLVKTSSGGRRGGTHGGERRETEKYTYLVNKFKTTPIW